MSEQVKVEDLEVFRLFRVAMLKFAQAAEQSLSNADGEIARTHSWLETEQATFWQGQLRKRTEAVGRARDALRQKQLYRDSTGHTPNASEEEKMLRRCLAAAEEAEHKIDAVRKWRPRLEKEADLYRGGVSRLSGSLSVEIPRAVALLDRLAATLEQYVQIEGSAVNMAGSTTPATLAEPMSRGGAAEPPVTVTPATPPADAHTDAAPASQTDVPARKEGRDVADGK